MSTPPLSGSDPAPPSSRENQRLAALRALQVLDTPREATFDDLTALVADICQTPIALISLIDESRQWFKSAVGLTEEQTPRKVAFCAHALDQPDLLLVPDATQDPRFAANPLVTGKPGIRFYAGAPLITPEGHTLGTLCVLDRVPRQLNERQLTALRVLGRQVMTELQLRHRLREHAKAEEALRQSEREQRGLVQNLETQRARLVEAQAVAKVGSWETDLATMAVIWSEETHRIFETDPLTFAPTHARFLERVHPDDRAAVDQAFQLAHGSHEIQAIEHRLLLPDGRIKFIMERWRVFRDEAGRPVRATGTCRDITERKTTEEERDRLFRLSLDLLCVAGFDGRLQQVNPAWTECLGWTAAELTSRPMLDFVHPDDHAATLRSRAEIHGGQSSRGFENRYRCKDGSYRWLSWSVHPLTGSRQIFGVARDVTAVREAQTALRVSEEQYRLLFANNPHPMWVFDLETLRILAVNTAAQSHYGYSEAEFLALRVIDLRAPEDAITFADAIAWLPPTGKATALRRHRRKDGTTIEVEATSDNVMLAGRPARLTLAHDVTERRRVEERVTEQAALLDNAHDAIIVRDPVHRVTYWNKSAERLYGWTAAEARGRRLDELLRIDGLKFAEAQRATDASGSWNGEIQKTAKGGAVLTVEGSWTMLRDSQGAPRCILTIDTDITERKKLEQQFLRAQRMESIGTLAGGIAHDLNNLLAPITMGVDLLKLFEPNPKSLPVIENIERSAKRGAELVKQVLSFARGVEGARVALQVRHILKEIDAIAVNTFPKNITVGTSLPPELWPVLADPTQLNQVVLNLCVNARDAMPNGGRLELGASNVDIDPQYAVMNRGMVPGRHVLIQVADTGTGMPQEIIDRIFEPFFTTKELGKGTGLGLSTVLGIVRSHGGFVNVYSEVGRGSTFKVYLPALETGAGPVADPHMAEALPRGNGELILVVDDETSILDITKQTLLAFGYRVVTAEDGAQAISCYALQRDEVALVLTDMMMPVMDGSTLILALQRINPRVRVIAASGLKGNNDVARATSAGVKHFLPKPYSADMLLQLVHQVLRNGGSRPPV